MAPSLEACLKDADLSAQLSKLTEFGILRLADMEGLTADDYEAMDIPAQIASDLPGLYKEWSAPSYTPGRPMKRAGSKVKQIQEELQLDQVVAATGAGKAPTPSKPAATAAAAAAPPAEMVSKPSGPAKRRPTTRKPSAAAPAADADAAAADAAVAEAPHADDAAAAAAPAPSSRWSGLTLGVAAAAAVVLIVAVLLATKASPASSSAAAAPDIPSVQPDP